MVLGPALQIACATIYHVRERKTLSAVCGFLESIGNCQLGGEAQQVFDATLEEHGQVLFLVLLSAIAGNVPSNALRKVGAAFYSLLVKCGEVGQGWTVASLASPDFINRLERPEAVNDRTKQLFLSACGTLLKNNRPRRKFISLIDDFSKVSQGMSDADCLLDYNYE
jgi:hypothetical protein